MMLVDSTSCLVIWLTTDILRNAQKGPNSKSMLALEFCFISFFKGRWTSYFQGVFFAYSVLFFSFLRGGTITITNICCNVPLSNVGSQDLNPHHLTSFSWESSRPTLSFRYWSQRRSQTTEGSFHRLFTRTLKLTVPIAPENAGLSPKFGSRQTNVFQPAIHFSGAKMSC